MRPCVEAVVRLGLAGGHSRNRAEGDRGHAGGACKLLRAVALLAKLAVVGRGESRYHARLKGLSAEGLTREH